VTVVGVIGLGNMGSAFAERLLAEGHQVVGSDLVDERLSELQRLGGRPVGSAAEVAAAAESIVLSLPSAEALAAVAGALAQATLAERVIVETSTLSVEAKRSAHVLLAAGGATLLDASVSGTPGSVRAGELALYASGDRAAFDRVRPALEGFARSVRFVGEFGNAMRLKMICNLLVVIHDAASAEAMALGIGAGFDPELVYDVVCESIGSSRIWEQRAKMMVEEDYRPGSATFTLAVKDGALIDEFTRETGTFSPMFQLGRQLHAAGLGFGLGDLDGAALLQLYRALST
jgi:3-hydroxyisobutyrate dehydrogenase-like beta-hydroxyacid dehydrogenase